MRRGIDLKRDVVLLDFAQFSTLHMAVSLSGVDYRICGEEYLSELLSDGWAVIAKRDTRIPDYLLLEIPQEDEENVEE